MANLKQSNLADQQLIVGSLKVLNDISNSGIATIRRSVANLETAVSNVSVKTAEFWKDIADDSVITPVEKKTLKKNWNTITQTYTAIMKVAAEKSVLSDETIIAFQTKYTSLYTYLFTTLRVFDDMSTNTEIKPSVAAFNNYFNEYAEYETLAQNVINKSSVTTIRQLSNLSESGTEGEVALYGNSYYQYQSGEWKILNAAGYIGVYTTWPLDSEQIIDRFLLANGVFVINNKILKTKSGKLLMTKTGKFLVKKEYTESGYIYNYTENGWQKITDRNDWRYIVALNDLIELGYDISGNLQNYITEQAAEVVENTNGNYLGSFIVDPENPGYNDYYLFSGVTTSERTNGTLYQYKKSTSGVWAWTELSSSDVNNYNKYMTCLNDLLTMQQGAATEGIFSTIFAKALVACGAFIENLATKVINLQNGGVIQSDTNNTLGTGFVLKYDGSAMFSKEVVINGDTKIYGNAKFTGEISSGPLELLNQTTEGASYTFPSGTAFTPNVKVADVTGSYKGYSFFSLTIEYTNTYGYDWEIVDVDAYYLPTEMRSRSTLKLYDSDGNLLYTEFGAWNYWYKNTTNPDYDKATFWITAELSYVFNTTTGDKTFRLYNLPTTEPSIVGTVWNDNGTLKIKI